MQVRTSTSPCISHEGNNVSLPNRLTPFDHNFTVMAISCQGSVRMLYFHEEAISTLAPAGKDDSSIRSGNNRSANIIGDINAAMLATPTPAVA